VAHKEEMKFRITWAKDRRLRDMLHRFILIYAKTALPVK
jgi:hypothetical protein